MVGHRKRRLWGVVAVTLLAASLAPPATAQSPEPRPRPQPRIVGGTPVADIDDFGHIAFLDVGGALCGGSLVTPTWVMTAAHCFFDGFGFQVSFAGDITAFLNTTVSPFASPPPDMEVRTADLLVIHPDYDDFFPRNDIALFRLTSPSGQAPTGLASVTNTGLWAPGDVARVAGWGTTSFGGPLSDDLLEVDVPIISDAACNGSIAGPIDDDTMICAGDLPNGGKDACQGDSGGPLSVPGPTTDWITVGIVSFGIGCGDPNSPGVYTEVAAFRAWIKSVIPGFNEPPVVVDDGYSVDEGGTLQGNFPGAFGNDLDPDGDVLAASSHTEPAHGTLDFFATGTFLYVHDGSETTADTFTYVATDGLADSNPATVTITVNPVNDPPVAVPDAFSVDEGGTLTVNGVLDNDTDAEGDPLTAQLATGPAHGTLSLAPDGSFTYVHDGSETTADTFTYVASDGAAASATTTVQLAIDPVNDRPTARDDGPFQVERAGILIGSGILGNDADADGDPLTARLEREPAHGTLSLNPDGSFVYRHDGSAATADTFTYRADDGTARSGVATVTIRIRPDSALNVVGVVDQDSGLWLVSVVAPNGELLPPFFFGNPGDDPFLGDWDGDGVATPGLYRPSDGKVYLRNSNTPGIADIEFFFGDPGDVPIVGDWDGDGDDTVSVYRPSIARVYIQNDLGSGNRGLGPADFSYTLGDPFDTPFAADFDGDGADSVGIKRGNTFYWRNALDFGPLDNPAGLPFGDAGDQPLFGDWDGDGVATPGVHRPGEPIYVRDDRLPGIAEWMIFADGFESGDVAVWGTTP